MVMLEPNSGQPTCPRVVAFTESVIETVTWTQIISVDILLIFSSPGLQFGELLRSMYPSVSQSSLSYDLDIEYWQNSATGSIWCLTNVGYINLIKIYDRSKKGQIW